MSRNRRIRHLVRVDEEALLEWLADFYRKKLDAMSTNPFNVQVGDRIDDVKAKARALGFDPEDSAIIGTTFSEGGLSFIVLEIKHHLKAVK